MISFTSVWFLITEYLKKLQQNIRTTVCNLTLITTCRCSVSIMKYLLVSYNCIIISVTQLVVYVHLNILEFLNKAFEMGKKTHILGMCNSMSNLHAISIKRLETALDSLLWLLMHLACWVNCCGTKQLSIIQKHQHFKALNTVCTVGYFIIIQINFCCFNCDLMFERCPELNGWPTNLLFYFNKHKKLQFARTFLKMWVFSTVSPQYRLSF